jgi:hypothetical protein
MASRPGRIAYRIGAGVALPASFAAGACAFTARLRADGMARAMLAVAGPQALLALAVATAPSTARIEPMSAIGVLALSGGFTALWLVAAALFHRSARLASRPPRPDAEKRRPRFREARQSY